jgi:SAM-dependent methyltransferase
VESADPKMVLTYYSGEDLYSDGDIENELLQIVTQHTDYQEILSRDNRWPILYHLTPNRRNLLEWVDFKAGSRLLEIGAGCGALTGLFCERLGRVTAVELSKRRAEIIATRHRGQRNLEILVGNLLDMKLDDQFDYVTLIGVLEYAAKYVSTQNPYQDFLLHIKRHLKPDGVLIVAIENKFGLKYWAGAREDHTGGLFDSLENYIHDPAFNTFSKEELTNLLGRCSFKAIDFYYPVPDYKIPVQIFSDNYLPETGQIDRFFPNYDNDRLVLFDERLVFDNLILSNKFDFFANSFLLFCRNEKDDENHL